MNVVEAELARLRELNGRLGRVPDLEVTIAAARIGCSPGHVRRLMVVAFGRRRGPRWEVEEWLMPLLYAHGNLSALHQDLLSTRAELEAAGERVPVELERVPRSYATFQRAFSRLPAALLDFPRTGTNGLRRRFLYLTWQAERRNELWQADTTQLDIWILPRRRAVPVRPWLIGTIDDRHRLVMGAALSIEPPTAEVAAASIANAMRIRSFETCEGEFGGRPERLLVDNGPEWRGRALTTMAAAAGVVVTPTLRHTPTQKGKIERWFGTFQRWVLASLPGYTKGPKSWSGTNLYHGDLDSLLDEHELWAHINERITAYNETRHHRVLDATPAASWLDDTAPLVEVPEGALRHAVVLNPTRRVAHRDGVWFRQRRYVSPDSCYDDWIEQRVTVGFLPHDDSRIELYGPDGQWVTTGLRADLLSDAEQLQVVRRRFQNYDYVRDFALQARELREERAGAATAGGDMPRFTTLLLRRTGPDPTHSPNALPDVSFLDASTTAIAVPGEQLRLFEPSRQQVRRRA